MKKCKNNKDASDVWCGQEIQPGTYYTLDQQEEVRWASDDKVLADIGSADLIVNDGTSDITSVFNAIAFMQDKMLQVVETTPFSAKVIEGKKLYKRVHGIKSVLEIGNNTILFSVPYNWVKITGLELVGGEAGDTASFYVLDTPGGTFSGAPNYTLNQFGFSVNVAPSYYEHKSEFDADLYLAMQVKLVYASASAKTIGINLILNEVK